MGDAATSRRAPLTGRRAGATSGPLPGGTRPPGSGRKPGTPNSVTKSVKDAILKVYAMVGGDAGLAQWAMENRTEFYKLYARLLPIQLATTDVNRPLEVRLMSFSDTIPEHMQRATRHRNDTCVVDAEVTSVKPLAPPRSGG